MVKLNNNYLNKKNKRFHSNQIFESEITNGEIFKAESVKDNTVLLL